MQSMNLNELLRYGFAGAVFILVALFAFDDPRVLFVANRDVAGALAVISSAAGLTLGCVIYALHRAIPFPILYQLFKWLNFRMESTLELDIQRWRHTANKNAMQYRLGEWAAQVHFLYCIAWATGTALLIGAALNWSPASTYEASWWLFAAVSVSSLVHHFRYQRWERRVFQEDTKLLMEQQQNNNTKQHG